MTEQTWPKIENITNPGQALAIGDRYSITQENGTFKIAIFKEVAEAQQQAIRKIHKSDFIERMLPYWTDVKATRSADPVVDGYFEMFTFYKFVDLDWDKTQAMVGDLVNRIKTVVPETLITTTVLLADGTPTEAYGE